MKFEKYPEDLRARQAQVRPHGTPSDVVYPLGEISLPEHVAYWARRYPDRAAIIFEGRAVGYRELDDLSRLVAGWLESVGVTPGDRVAAYLPSCSHAVHRRHARRAAPRCGARAGESDVPVPELAYELNGSGAEVVVTLDRLLPRLESVRPGTAARYWSSWLRNGSGFRAARGREERPCASGHRPSRTSLPTAHLDALAALNYTSGTTGLSEGRMHT